MLRGMCGVIRLNRFRNEYIGGSIKEAPVSEKIKSNCLVRGIKCMLQEEF